MTLEQIAREYDHFRSVIPASTGDYARRRTAYFYKKQAIAWARLARQWWPDGGKMQTTCRNLAKHYLAAYRNSKRT